MKKIKKFFQDILSSISMFFNKLGRTKPVKAVGNVLTYLPNKFADNIPYKKRQKVWGVIFIVPTMIGLVYFFLLPFITTIIYSFSNVVRINTSRNTGEWIGIVTESIGFDNYKYIFTEHATFSDVLWTSFQESFINVPMILIFSLIIAVVLNSKFRGRAFVRAIFFMPVIFNSQAVDVAMKTGQAFTDALEAAGDDVFTAMFNFSDFLTNANIPTTAVTFLSTASSQIFDVITYSGVQMLIFLSAIQSVPKHLYEAAKIEGATQYEIFWKITFPMVSPMMLTCAVYTVVDSFLRSDLLTTMGKYEQAGSQLFETGLGDLTYDGIYAAMSMMFTLSSIVVIAIWLLALRKMVFYYDE